MYIFFANIHFTYLVLFFLNEKVQIVVAVSSFGLSHGILRAFHMNHGLFRFVILIWKCIIMSLNIAILENLKWNPLYKQWPSAMMVSLYSWAVLMVFSKCWNLVARLFMMCGCASIFVVFIYLFLFSFFCFFFKKKALKACWFS